MLLLKKTQHLVLLLLLVGDVGELHGGSILLLWHLLVLLLDHHQLLLLLEERLELLFVELIEEFFTQDWHLNDLLLLNTRVSLVLLLDLHVLLLEHELLLLLLLLHHLLNIIGLSLTALFLRLHSHHRSGLHGFYGTVDTVDVSLFSGVTAGLSLTVA